jgi:hypothetical protein
VTEEHVAINLFVPELSLMHVVLTYLGDRNTTAVPFILLNKVTE